MSTPNVCLSPAELERLTQARLSSEELDRVCLHLEQCQRCLATIAGQRDDTLTAALRRARPEALAAADSSVTRELLDRLNRLAPANATRSLQPTDEAAEVRACLEPAQADDEIGRLGDYRVLRVLGSGGMGVVFLAEEVALKRQVALKIVKPKAAALPQNRQRFLREVQAAAALHHDHVMPIYHVGESNGLPYFTMPLLHGESLDSRLRREGRLPLGEVLRIGREAALALAAAHERGLVHRDVKPGNLWLEGEPTPSGAGGRVKLLDFGLVRPVVEDVHLTQEGAIVGTPAYMAPEQAQGEEVDPRCDLFSLGCVLYRCCTGQLPFEGKDALATLLAVKTAVPRPPGELNPDVPPPLSDLILRLLAKERRDRPESAAAVAGALDDMARTEAGPAVATARQPSRRRRSWARVAVAVTAVFGALVAGVVLYWQTNNGVVRIEIDDPDIQVAFDQNGPTFKGADKHETRISAGAHALHVQRDGLEFDTDKLILKRGETITLKVEFFTEGKLQVVQGDRVLGAKTARPVAAGWQAREDAWLKEVAALPPVKQVEAVAAKLKEHNPHFPVRVQLDKAEGGVVAGLSIFRPTWPWGDQERFHLSPVRALPGLKSLSFVNLAVSDLSPLKNLPLTSLDLYGTLVSDLSPLQGLLLTRLKCKLCPMLSNLSPLEGIKLTNLDCSESGVIDLSPLKGMPLTTLICENTKVSDLSPLKGMPLAYLDCRQSKVTDLSPLKDMPLKELLCDEEAERDLETLRALKPPLLVNGTPVTQIREELDLAKGPFEEWLKKVAALPSQKQVRAVAGRLRLDNPARVELQKVEGGKVAAIRISGRKVSDLSPVRVLTALKSVDFIGTAVSDLSPLKDLPLTTLAFFGTPVSDLTPLKGMSLTYLNCSHTRVSDLTPLKGMPLTWLGCESTAVSDLSPLKDMKLTELYCHNNMRVTDLSPLKGMPLRELRCDFKAERDTELLRSLKTLATINGKPAAEFLK